MSEPDLFTPSVISVSELTGEIKSLLEGHFIDIRVEGEISNASTSRNGHTYFTLKDEDAQLSCVMWRSRSQSLDLNPVDGQQVIAGGDIQVYPPHGKYQLIVRSLEQAGVGALQKAFEKLKAKLKKEGLFDEIHKKRLPPFPLRIGVITSATGAAFHDIRDTLERRWPPATVLLHHASVQGVNAAPELVGAINRFSEEQQVDLLIIGRGGGSLEDLWPFNEEAVARALFKCGIPVISAVGHEVDFSITDFIADVRASTPTQAAVIATPDINEIRFFLEDLSARLSSTVELRVEGHKERIYRLMKSHALLAVKEKVSGRYERVKNLMERIGHHRELRFIRKKERLKELKHRLELENPDIPLQQGFTRIWQDEQWIKSAERFDPQKTLTVEWKDGKKSVK